MFNRGSVLSAVPEQGTVVHHLLFCLIGADSRRLADSIANCATHTLVFELLATPRLPSSEKHTGSGGSGGKYKLSSNSAKPKDVFSGIEAQLLAGAPKTSRMVDVYCLLSEDDMTMVKIKIKPVETFTDSVSDLRIRDGELRNTCFIYMIDDRKDMKVEVLPVLDSSLAEMRFLYNSLKKRSASNNKLRRVLLTHQPGASDLSSVEGGSGDAEGDGPPTKLAATSVEDPPQVAAFLQKLSMPEIPGSFVRPRRKADFDVGDAAFMAIQRLARELISANSGDTTLAARITASMGLGSMGLGNSATERGGAGHPCCVTQ